MSRKTLGIALFALIVCTGCGPTKKEYVLRIKETAGNKWQYTYKVKTFADPKNLKKGSKLGEVMKSYTTAEVEGWVQMEVKSVKDGKTTFAKTNYVTNASATGPWKSQAEEMKKAKPDSAEYTWDERMTNVNIAKGGYVDPMTNSLHTLFPKEAIHVGSTWTYIPFPDYQREKEAKAKFEGIETVHGIEAVKISVKIPAANPGEKNDMMVWFDPKNGRFIKITTHTQGDQEGLHVENDFTQELKS